MSDAREPCVLLTIPISHYCERARWALDRAGVPYRERAHLQMIHWVAVRRAGGDGTVPVLVCGKRVLADSADIVAHASSLAPAERRLYPDDPEAAAEVRALEEGFAEHLGPEGRLWMYHSLHGRRDLALAYGCTGVPRWEREFLRLGYPLLIRVIDRFLEITPAAAARAESTVRASFDAVAERLADGRPYLCGTSFTAADLTFSALAAAVLMPPEYGVPLPQPDELPAGMAAIVRELREHRAGKHAMAMFRTERVSKPEPIEGRPNG
jgi:glutathione S-transferase